MFVTKDADIAGRKGWNNFKELTKCVMYLKLKKNSTVYKHFNRAETPKFSAFNNFIPFINFIMVMYNCQSVIGQIRNI